MLVISLKNLNDYVIEVINKNNFIAELRLDFLNIETVKHFYKKIKTPVIFKFFTPQLKRLISSKDYIDVDIDDDFASIQTNFPHVKKILSYHNFDKTPPLEDIFFKMQRFKADIYKIATFATSSIDSLKMLSFVKNQREKGYNICGICMGTFGEITRILAPIVGSFTYARIQEQTAKGQLDYAVLINRYRYLQLNQQSKILALIGTHVERSIGEIVHNKILSNTNNVFVKINLKKDELKDFFNNIKTLPFIGICITMPFKEEVAGFVNTTKTCINTAYFNNEWFGYNTDGIGAIKALEKRVFLEDKKVVVLGAGGAAKSIISKLKNVLCLNRDIEKAYLVSKEFNCKYGSIYDLKQYKDYDIIINATSCGDPISSSCILKNSLAMEINVLPQKTKFLQKAIDKNCKVIYGFEMFIYQAKEQYKIFKFHPTRSLKHL